MVELMYTMEGKDIGYRCPECYEPVLWTGKVNKDITIQLTCQCNVCGTRVIIGHGKVVRENDERAVDGCPGCKL